MKGIPINTHKILNAQGFLTKSLLDALIIIGDKPDEIEASQA